MYQSRKGAANHERSFESNRQQHYQLRQPCLRFVLPLYPYTYCSGGGGQSGVSMTASRAEVLLSVIVYAVSLLVASLSNLWLSVWGRRLAVLNTYFRSHQPLFASDEDSVRIDPFDLAALEASMSAAAAAVSGPTSGEQSAAATCEHGVTTSPVFDIGLHFLPHFHNRWLPDAFVFVMLPLLVAAVFLPTAAARFGHRGAYWPPVLARLCCVLQSHSVILMMRSSTTLATVHRASPVCHALSLESSTNPGFVLNTGCFDLMFSGHTAFCALASFFVCHRPELAWPVQLLVAVLAAAGSVSNVLVGDHFTADCLVGAHIAVLVCCLFRQRFKLTFAATSPPNTALHTPATVTYSDNSSHAHTAPHVSQPAADNAQLMDVDEQHKPPASNGEAGMDMELSPTFGAANGGREAYDGTDQRDDGVEEKELQQLITRWQLADSHTAARRMRRHTDFR